VSGGKVYNTTLDKLPEIIIVQGENNPLFSPYQAMLIFAALYVKLVARYATAQKQRKNQKNAYGKTGKFQCQIYFKLCKAKIKKAEKTLLYTYVINLISQYIWIVTFL